MHFLTLRHDFINKPPQKCIFETLNFFRYECQKKYNGTVQMCSVGCVHNGVRYKIGDQWPVNFFLQFHRASQQFKILIARMNYFDFSEKKET